MKLTFNSFAEFYPYYLEQHCNRISRLLHLLGILGGVACFLYGSVTARYIWLPTGLICGYACGWTGHFWFEKNRPATFGYPLYSLIGDFRMALDTLRGRW
jgi:hypothetical protein